MLIRHLIKTGAGIETPDNVKGDTDAESVFFCVGPAHTLTMVALVGQLSGWPVTLYAGIPTPASVTAIMSVGTQAVTP